MIYSRLDMKPKKIIKPINIIILLSQGMCIYKHHDFEKMDKEVLIFICKTSPRSDELRHFKLQLYYSAFSLRYLIMSGISGLKTEKVKNRFCPTCWSAFGQQLVV